MIIRLARCRRSMLTMELVKINAASFSFLFLFLFVKREYVFGYKASLLTILEEKVAKKKYQ